jgi:23S rRNA (adenine2503-C2)-methyltransferase
MLPVTSRPLFHDESAVEQFRKQHRIDPDRIRRTRYALYQMFDSFETAFARLGENERNAALEHFDRLTLSVAEKHNSNLDGSTKLVLQTVDGYRIETVVIRAETSRTAVCVSTQVGCQAGCPFCATARMKLHRSLNAYEIAEQVLLAAWEARESGRRLRNVVFMGMGEPLHNEEQVYPALDLLMAPTAFRIPPRRITVSTVGIPDAMIRLADRFPGIQIALSLHSAIPEKRQKLVPWTRQITWEGLHSALRDIANRPRLFREQGPVMIEHILIHELNDGEEDADALIEYLEGIPCIVNLIPYNPIPTIGAWESTPRERREVFWRKLREAGIFTTFRYSMGSDVQAACGQLAQPVTPIST